jgi:hypothetical protein
VLLRSVPGTSDSFWATVVGVWLRNQSAAGVIGRRPVKLSSLMAQRYRCLGSWKADNVRQQARHCLNSRRNLQSQIFESRSRLSGRPRPITSGTVTVVCGICGATASMGLGCGKTRQHSSRKCLTHVRGEFGRVTASAGWLMARLAHSATRSRSISKPLSAASTLAGVGVGSLSSHRALMGEMKLSTLI